MIYFFEDLSINNTNSQTSRHFIMKIRQNIIWAHCFSFYHALELMDTWKELLFFFAGQSLCYTCSAVLNIDVSQEATGRKCCRPSLVMNVNKTDYEQYLYVTVGFWMHLCGSPFCWSLGLLGFFGALFLLCLVRQKTCLLLYKTYKEKFKISFYVTSF